MAQTELFPLSPETLLAWLRNLEAKVLTVAPELSKRDCDQLLCELAITRAKLDQIGDRIRRSPEYQLRMQLPAVPAPVELPPDRLVVPKRGRWRLPSPRVAYSPVKVPDEAPPEGSDRLLGGVHQRAAGPRGE